MDNTQTPTPEAHVTALLEGPYAFITTRVICDPNPHFAAEVENLADAMWCAADYSIFDHGDDVLPEIHVAVIDYLQGAWENGPLNA